MCEVEGSGDKRRSRILAVQKKLLVQLIENFFIRATGSCDNVNFECIDSDAWQGFAEILNTWGPKKTADQWKTSFYFMKNRIRKSVSMIRQADANLTDNLSSLDYKLYSMSPSGFFGVMSDEIQLNRNYYGATYEDVVMPENEDRNFDGVADEGVLEDGNVVDSAGKSQYQESNEFGADTYDLDDESNANLENESTPTIFIDEEEDRVEPYYENSHRSLGKGKRVEIPSSTTVPKGAKANKPMDAVKTRTKIPELQKERLVQLVQNNFAKAFGRFAGENGAYIKAQLWNDFAKELNSLGPPRTGDQWKTTFNTTSAKCKLADDHNNAPGSVNKHLTRLEEKVLSIYGLDALDGDQNLGEAGFQYAKTIPTARRIYNSTATSENAHNQDEFIPEPEVGRKNDIKNAEACNEENTNNSNASCENEEEYNSDDSVLREIIREIYDEDDVDKTETYQPQESNTVSPANSGRASSAREIRLDRPLSRAISPADGKVGRNQSNSRYKSARHISAPGFRPRCSKGVLNSPAVGDGRNRSDTGSNSGRAPLGRGIRPDRPLSRTVSPADGEAGRNQSNSRFISGRDILTPGSRPHCSISGLNLTSVGEGRNRSDTGSNSGRLSSAREIRLDRSLNRVNTPAVGEVVGRNPSNSRSNSGRDISAPRCRPHCSMNVLNSTAVGHGRNQSDAGSTLGSHPHSSSRVNSPHRDRGASNIAYFVPSGRGASNGVVGVPRLRGSSRRDERIEYITNIQQLFPDYGRENECDEDEEDRARSNQPVARPERDRSNLRHRYTSYEMVQRSMNDQEQFIEQNMRNHSEMMFVTERNHFEIVGMFNSTLRTLANVAQEYVNKM